MTIHDIANECWAYGTRYGEETAGGEVWWRGVEQKLAILTAAHSTQHHEVRRLIRERLAGAPLDPPTSTLTASCSRCGVLFVQGGGRNTIPEIQGEFCNSCIGAVRVLCGNTESSQEKLKAMNTECAQWMKDKGL